MTEFPEVNDRGQKMVRSQVDLVFPDSLPSKPDVYSVMSRHADPELYQAVKVAYLRAKKAYELRERILGWFDGFLIGVVIVAERLQTARKRLVSEWKRVKRYVRK